MQPSAPALTVCIITRNSSGRLPRLLAQVGGFAEQVVVGVDASSDDGTMEIASDLADVVFRFAHAGNFEPARLLVLDYATGDWILVLDDDEMVDGAFAALVPDLLEDHRYTHYWFPRKWLIRADPPEYVRALPWFPDWQLRLFRNDRGLVWHSGAIHENYRVIGPGCHEERTAILHLERILLSDEDRREKVVAYRRLPGGGRFQDFYGSLEGMPRATLESPPRGEAWPALPRRSPNRIVEGIQSLRSPEAMSTWHARLQGGMPRTLRPRETVLVEIRAMNDGQLRWAPPTETWPRLFFSYHVVADTTAREVLVWDGERTAVGRVVDPGESCTCFATFTAPARVGDFVVLWDLVSEGECWFAERGSQPLELGLSVRAGDRSWRRSWRRRKSK